MKAGRTFVLLIGGLASPLFAGGPGAETAADEDVRDLVEKQAKQIERLEGEVSRLKEHQAASRASALEEDIQLYLADTETDRRDSRGTIGSGAFGQRVRVGGYISLEFRDNGDDSNSFFDAHRLVPKIQADIAEGITFETEIEIEGGGADVSFLSGNEILVEYAEIRFEIIEDKLTFKVGLVLIPWGRFNRFHDDPLNDLTDRPLVSRHVGATAFDQPGIGAEGTLEFGDGWFLDYDLALVQGFDDGFDTANGVRGARQSFRADNNNNKQVFGRFVVSPPVQHLDVLEFGASFAYGKHDPAGDLTNYGYALEVFLKKGRFEMTGEFMTLRVEQAAGAPASAPRRLSGWYVEFAYHIFPAGWRGKHALLTDESTFTFVVRVEDVDLNHATTGTEFRDDLQQVSIGFNFRPVERTVFKVSYTFVDSEQPGTSGRDMVVVSWASYF